MLKRQNSTWMLSRSLILSLLLHTFLAAILLFTWINEVSQPQAPPLMRASLIAERTQTTQAPNPASQQASANLEKQSAVARKKVTPIAQQSISSSAVDSSRFVVEQNTQAQAAKKAAAQKAQAIALAKQKAAEKIAADKARAIAQAKQQAAAKAAAQKAQAAALSKAAQVAIRSDFTEAIGSASKSANQALQAAQAANDLMNIIRRTVEQSWIKPDTAQQQPIAQVRVTLLPATGELLSATIVRTSHDPAFDESAIQAVQRAAPFVELARVDTSVQQRFRSFTLTFDPKEVQ